MSSVSNTHHSRLDNLRQPNQSLDRSVEGYQIPWVLVLTEEGCLVDGHVLEVYALDLRVADSIQFEKPEEME